MTRGRSQQVLVGHWDGRQENRRPDELVVEEPLTIRLDDVTVTTTMRTPGHDFELAAGFCFTEGLLADASVTSIRYCATEPAADAEFNLVTVETDGAPPPTPRLGLTTSSCGLCGTESIDALRERLSPLPPASTLLPPDVLAGVPERVVARQDLFGATGGVHAAAVFAADGEPVLVREDIGRHNAVDKVIGHFVLRDEVPLRDRILVVSGRAGFELVQKALMAAIPAMVSVGAASSVAVDMAMAAGMTLYSFAGRGRGNLHVA